jgi:hypothetical protein
MVLGGRVAWADAGSRQALHEVRRAREAVPRGREGSALRDDAGQSPARGIPGDSPASPFQAGIGWHCKEERLVYRVVAHLNPADCWAATKFWQQRWNVHHWTVLILAREGLLDAAIEQHSQVRRFRCRNEAAVLRHPEVLRLRLERSKSGQERAAAPLPKGAPKRVNGRWVRQ